MTNQELIKKLRFKLLSHTASAEEIDTEDDCIGKVVWDDETISFQVTNRLSAESYEVLDECSVIGNIFDNPELLFDNPKLLEEWLNETHIKSDRCYIDSSSYSVLIISFCNGRSGKILCFRLYNQVIF